MNSPRRLFLGCLHVGRARGTGFGAFPERLRQMLILEGSNPLDKYRLHHQIINPLRKGTHQGTQPPPHRVTACHLQKSLPCLLWTDSHRHCNRPGRLLRSLEAPCSLPRRLRSLALARRSRRFFRLETSCSLKTRNTCPGREKQLAVTSLRKKEQTKPARGCLHVCVRGWNPRGPPFPFSAQVVRNGTLYTAPMWELPWPARSRDPPSGRTDLEANHPKPRTIF